MIINGIDFKRYCETHTDDTLDSVLQFLEVFIKEHKLTSAVRGILKARVEHRAEAIKKQKSATRESEKEEAVKVERREQPPLVIPINVCPKCGSMMMGEPSPGCESKSSGRVFYTECSACKYYYEIFQNKRTKKYKKIEGGTI
jgi:hypothetical protein